MTNAQRAERFAAKYTGQYIDEDKWYGSQCWDVSARYAREEYGCPSFNTGSGGAEGLYRIYAQPIPQFFDKISGSQLQGGDIAVWDKTFYEPWGHTAVVLWREGNTVWVIEQDGSKDPNGDGIADGVAYVVQRTITSKINGLRPKGKAIVMTEDGVRFGILAVTGGKPMKEYEIEVKYWTNRDPAEFAKYLYGMSDNYMVQAYKDIASLKKQLADSGNTEFVETKVYTKKS